MKKRSIAALTLGAMTLTLLTVGPFDWFNGAATATHDSTGAHIDQLSIDTGPAGGAQGVTGNGRPAIGDRNGDTVFDAEGYDSPDPGDAPGVCGNNIDDDPHDSDGDTTPETYDGSADDGCRVTLTARESCLEIIDDGILNADEDTQVAGQDRAMIDITVGAQPGPGGGIPATRPMTAWQYSFNWDVDVLDIDIADRNFLILAAGAGTPFNVTTESLPDVSSPFTISVSDGVGTAAAETGPGVLSRITIEGNAPGLANLTLSGVAIQDTSNQVIPVDIVNGAKVAVSKDVNNDGDLNDSGESFTCAAAQYADTKTISVNSVAPAVSTVGTAFTVSVDATLHDNGPLAPVNVDVSLELSLPSDCTAVVNPVVVQDLVLLLSIPASIATQAFSVTCLQTGLHTFVSKSTVGVDQPGVVDPNPGNNQMNSNPASTSTQSSSTADTDGDGVPDALDNCQATPNPNQANFDGDAAGDVCDSDSDDDKLPNSLETSCGSNILDAAARPERTDGTFNGVDDDGDTAVDEALPPGSGASDCDGDGWTGSQEQIIFSASSTANDQDPCGSNGWPADVAGNDNRLNIGDINSFIFPLRGDGSFNKFNHPVPDAQDPSIARWNLQPDAMINIGDLNALNPGVTATTSRPPMLGGQPAFFTNGGQCPYPP